MVKRNIRILLTVILGMLLSLTTGAIAVDPPPPPEPEITVTDSVAPVDDLQIPFGDVTEYNSSDQTVTVTNDGNVALNIGNIAENNPLVAPFSIEMDDCSTRAISPSASCTLTVRFSPTTTASFSDTFDIPSDDDDKNPVTVNVNGTGVVTPVPDITVTDSLSPNDDLQLPFCDVTENISSTPGIVTISNTGSAELNVSDIQLTGTDVGEFILDVNGGITPCGDTTLIIVDNCTVTVSFSPITTGAKSANLGITSDDPDEGTVNIALSGTGLSSAANNPPSTPQLDYPANGQTGLGTSIDFRWIRSTDPDGDTVTYDLSICKDEGLTIGCIAEEDIAFLENKGIYYAGIGGVGLLLFGIVLTGGVRGRAGQRRSREMGKRRCSKRKRIGFLIAIMVMLLVSCGGGSSGGSSSSSSSSGGGGSDTPPDGICGDTSDKVSHTILGLSTGTTYYWKVMAKDGKGGETDSDTRSFTTQ